MHLLLGFPVVFQFFCLEVLDKAIVLVHFGFGIVYIYVERLGEEFGSFGSVLQEQVAHHAEGCHFIQAA